ncbi:MAG TPA: phospholipase D-like domain-containing protein [Methylocella sp.]|nr:phospholipase D-like domain-containing protein [Methylocella sp.]
MGKASLLPAIANSKAGFETRVGDSVEGSRFRAGIGLLLGLVLWASACFADPAPIIHYAPLENLEHADVALIDRAEHDIDIAAYVLTDWPVMRALIRAAQRGVKVRVYMDGGRIGERTPTPLFQELITTPEIDVRFKRSGSPLMHLKSYQIDGRWLRTGAANFSASGLKRQDNDLLIIESQTAAAGFRRRFEAIFANGEVLPPPAAGQFP